jgi:hypothetical protein
VGEVEEREQRQLGLMNDRLEAFSRGKLFIGSTISDLEGLLNALELAPGDWKEQFIEEWGELEISYVVALDRQQPIPDATDPTIRMSLDRMIVLVQERLTEGG